MKKLLLITVLALTCAGITAPRVTAQSAQFQFSPISITAAPGENIVFGINLVFTAGGDIQDLNGLSFWLRQNGGSSFPFSITGRDNTSSPFTELQSTDFQLFTSPGNIVDADGNERDIGALSQGPLGSGTYFVANIQLTISGTATPGTYTITSTTTGGKTSVINDSDGETFPIQPDSLTVTIVPEPNTYALLAVGAIAAGFSVYRRRRTA